MKTTAALLLFGTIIFFTDTGVQGQGTETDGWKTVFDDGFDYPSAGLAEHWKGLTSQSWSDEDAAAPFAFSDRTPWRTERSTLYGANQNGILDNITCTVPFYGDISVKWDVLSEKDNLNFNCFMSGQDRWRGYMFHVAAFGDPLRCSLTLGKDDAELASARLPSPLPVRQWLHFRMELEGSEVRLFIDNRLVIRYVDPYPRTMTAPIYFGFENNLNNIQRIDGVRVQSKQQAPEPPAITAAAGPETDASAVLPPLPPGTNTADRALIDFEKFTPAEITGQWAIRLSPFSDNSENRNRSEWQIVDVNTSALPAGFGFARCLGLCMDIKDSTFEDYASFLPLTPLPELTTPEGRGVVRNVGLIRSVSVTVRGGNAGHGLELRLKDQFGRMMTVRFGTLDFVGWRKLTWQNPRYNDVRRDRALTKPPPPPLTPLTLTLDSIVVYKAYFENTGRFVGYIKDVRIEFDPATAGSASPQPSPPVAPPGTDTPAGE
jgi:hypothetical protein